MCNDALIRLRTVKQIKSEFSDMLRQHWNLDVAHQRFEVLWDEVNLAAINTLGANEGNAYIALLSHMLFEFDKQYRGVPLYVVTGTAHT